MAHNPPYVDDKSQKPPLLMQGGFCAVTWFQLPYLTETSLITKAGLFPKLVEYRVNNYLAQTVIGISIFTGTGLFGEVNLSLGILISLFVFPLQILFSYLWLEKYRFGPMEWLWRSATYGQLQPMKNKKAAISGTGQKTG